MPTVQIKLSKGLDKQLHYYMLDNNIRDKKIAIKTILKNQLKK